MNGNLLGPDNSRSDLWFCKGGQVDIKFNGGFKVQGSWLTVCILFLGMVFRFKVLGVRISGLGLGVRA